VSGAHPAQAAAAADRPIAVMLVDDSAVIRGLLRRWLEEAPDIAVVATAGDGETALRTAASAKPDVLVLDVEMPKLDGLSALPRLLKADPELKVIMSSTLTLRNADISIRALNLGAADYVAKPSSARELHAVDGFRRELVAKVRALANARPRRDRPQAAAPAPAALAPAPRKPIALRPFSAVPPKAIVVGSSTGGPQALFKFLGALGRRVAQPILLVQHMPASFTRILAEHLSKTAGVDAREAVAGEAVRPGRVDVAPGDWHMTVEGGAGAPVLKLEQSPAVNFCRPAVDPLFVSAAATFGPATLAVVLTGMGHDGLAGGRAIVAAGGSLLAQDEATSAVWGMPGAVAADGLCSAVLPLPEIGPAALKLAQGAGA
jgi:two-component system chemotaxis response regulator CheB